jgi:hypothetical protein
MGFALGYAMVSGIKLQHIFVYQLRQEQVTACSDSLHMASVCLSVYAT